jgi:hypothetical protein
MVPGKKKSTHYFYDFPKSKYMCRNAISQLLFDVMNKRGHVTTYIHIKAYGNTVSDETVMYGYLSCYLTSQRMHCKLQNRPLVREGALQEEEQSKCH